MTLRSATEDDVGRLADVEAQCFSDPWPADAFRSLVGQDHVRMAVACDAAGRVLGYVVLLRAADEGEIANIAVDPASRGRGLGGRLLDWALAVADGEGAATLFLEVRPSNTAATALYESRGFTAVARRRGYYQRPVEDALVLRRNRPG